MSAAKLAAALLAAVLAGASCVHEAPGPRESGAPAAPSRTASAEAGKERARAGDGAGAASRLAQWIAPTFFGIHINHTPRSAEDRRRQLDVARPAAFRSHDNLGLSWGKYIYSEGPDRPRWWYFDGYLAELAGRGIDVLYTFSRPPAWAHANPVPFAGPARREAFVAFATEVVKRSAGRIQAYEVWNEPNLDSFWYRVDQTMDELVASAADLRAIVDAHQPDAVIVCPSFTRIAGHLDQFDRFLRAGGAEHCDVIGYHFYRTTGSQSFWPPEASLQDIEQVRSLMADHGLAAMELWETEWGLNGPDLDKIPEGLEAAHVARKALVALGSGDVQRHYLYAWSHDYVTAGDDITPGPAAVAYQTIASWTVGRRMLSFSGSGARGRPSHVWTLTLEDADGRLSYIVWRGSQSLDGVLPDVAIDVPRGWRVGERVLLSGEIGQIPPGDRVTVGESPVLLRP